MAGGVSDRDRVLAAIDDALADGWVPWPGGHPDDIELALIDAVFSIQARYGQPADPATGRLATRVLRVVEHWSKHRGDTADNLQVIASTDPERFAEICDSAAKTAGRTKASAVQDAATALVAAGIRSSTDFKHHNDDAKRAYTSVHGLGWVTFTYLCMLLGLPDAKADIWIVRFVERTLNRTVDAHEAYSLVHACAEVLAEPTNMTLPRDATNLDHALWYYESNNLAETGQDAPEALVKRPTRPPTGRGIR